MTAKPSASEAIVKAASAELNLSPDVVGCPGTIADLVAPVVLREAASQLSYVCEQDANFLYRWADEIDRHTTKEPDPAADGSGDREQPPNVLADLFRRCANGRRTYLHSIDGDERFKDAVRLLRIQIETLDAVARVIDGDMGPLYNWLPSHLWTKPMLHALYNTPGSEGTD